MALWLQRPLSNDLASASTSEAIQDFITDCRLRNLSPASIEWYQNRLKRAFGPFVDLPLGQVGLQALRAHIGGTLDIVSPATVNAYLRAAKAFLNWAIEAGYDVNVMPSRLPRVKEPKRLPPVLGVEQMTALLSQPDTSRFAGLRDFTMILVALDTGVRVGELTGMEVGDISGDVVRVVGKGDKQRQVALSAPAARALRRYLRSRHETLKDAGALTTVLFPSRYGGRLSRKQVQERLADYARKAAIEGVRVSPHTLRYTFATHFLRNGGSIVALQQILGHTTLTMSRHYASVADTDAFEQSIRFSPVAAMKYRKGP